MSPMVLQSIDYKFFLPFPIEIILYHLILECGSDFYGENCQQRCYCLHGECDNKNGTCPEEECIEGWQPPTCSKVALLTVQPDDMVSSTTFNAVVAFSMIANVVLLAILTAVCWK